MSKSQSATDIFLDRWGHFVLMMGPHILALSILVWTPRLALLLAGIELLQFTLHVRGYHPTHPLATPIVNLPQIDSGDVAILMLVYGIWFAPCEWLVGWLILLQVLLSRHAHQWIHYRDPSDLLGVTILEVTCIVNTVFLVKYQITPGFPGFSAYLFG